MNLGSMVGFIKNVPVRTTDTSRLHVPKRLAINKKQ
jgi:hypothetical protein